MARPEDADFVKDLKEAKTAKDMVRSWSSQAPGRHMQRSLDELKLFIEKKPEMVEVFAQNIITGYVERGILDRKTRQLVMVGICMAMESIGGIVAQTANAIGAGCTEEEIMEVSYLVCYQACKSKMVMSAKALSEAFEYSKSVKRPSVSQK